MTQLAPEIYREVGIDGTWKVGFEAVATLFGDVSGKSILDYGSGTGRSTRFLRELGANVVGIDNSREMVAEAQMQNPDLEFRLLDETSPNRIFDAALSSFVHLEAESKRGMEEIARSVYGFLREDGIYVILTANSAMWGNDYESFSSYFPDDFAKRSGDKVNVHIKNPSLDFQDHYWEQDDYVDSLCKGGFTVVGARKVSGKEDWPPISPFLVITAIKKSKPENYQHDGIVYEPVFKTSRGSIYYLNRDSGLWLRSRERERKSSLETGGIVIGSLDPRFRDGRLDWMWDRFAKEGSVYGFAPEFRLNYEPFDLRLPNRQLTSTDFEEVSEGRVRLKDDAHHDQNLTIHVGNLIKEIYQHVNPLNIR